MCCPILKGAHPYTLTFFFFSFLLFFVFVCLHPMGRLHSAHETSITNTHSSRKSHNAAPPTTGSDGLHPICGPPPPRVAATTPGAGAGAMHSAATPAIDVSCGESKYIANTVILRRGLTMLTAAAVLMPGPTSIHEGRRRFNFRSEVVPSMGLLSEVSRAVPSTGRTGQERHAACIA